MFILRKTFPVEIQGAGFVEDVARSGKSSSTNVHFH